MNFMDKMIIIFLKEEIRKPCYSKLKMKATPNKKKRKGQGEKEIVKIKDILSATNVVSHTSAMQPCIHTLKINIKTTIIKLGTGIEVMAAINPMKKMMSQLLKNTRRKIYKT